MEQSVQAATVTPPVSSTRSWSEGLAFAIMVKVSPFSIRKEIEQDDNTALAILMGSVIIGVAHIIAASISG